MQQSEAQRWYAIGDLNAFFALFLDNVINLVILANILVFGFQFPKEVVLTKMIPGTALGVMVGDVIYTLMAIRLAKKTNKVVTAMPLGLDTPSTVGMALVVLGPAFLMFKGQSMTPDEAAMATWYLGSALLIWMGVIKFAASFFGNWVQRVVPTAGLLGSMAGIGIVWLAAEGWTKTMHHPLVGMISLAIVVFVLMAQLRLPKGAPGAAMAVLFGALLYYIFHWTGFEVIPDANLPNLSNIGLTLPWPESGIMAYVNKSVTFNNLAIAIPFGLLTIIGGINLCTAARIAGDNFNTREVLMTESIATLIAGLFGGVSQSTPYIGHGAYKAMGARAGYTLATGLLIGIGGFFGLISFIVGLIPEAAVAPILIFIGFEIGVSAYQSTDKRYMIATTFAIVPSILNYGYIKVKSTLADVAMYFKPHLAPEKAKVFNEVFTPEVTGTFLTGAYPYLEALAQGFIITAMIWGAAVTFLIDRKYRRAAMTFAIAGAFSFVGVMHSATNSGKLYLPWQEFGDGWLHSLPIQITIGYLLLAVLALWFKKDETNQPEFHVHQSEEMTSLAEDAIAAQKEL